LIYYYNSVISICVVEPGIEALACTHVIRLHLRLSIDCTQLHSMYVDIHTNVGDGCAAGLCWRHLVSV